MARGNDPGKDFDDQYNASRRRGQEKAARGESHWAEDAYLRRNNERLRTGPGHHGGGNQESGCGKATTVLIAVLGAVAGAVAAAVNEAAKLL